MYIRMNVRMHSPAHPYTNTATLPSVTEIQTCTSTELLCVQWWRMYPVHGNSSVKLHPTLFVQTNSSTCNYETPQRRSGQFDNTTRQRSLLLLRKYITGCKLQETMLDDHMQEVRILFSQPTLLCSFTLLPFRSRNNATSAWPFAAALKSGVVPNCT